VSFFLAQRPLPTSFSGFPRCHSIWLNAPINVTNCTLANNTILSGGGFTRPIVIFYNNQLGCVKNSIVWNNSAPGYPSGVTNTTASIWLEPGSGSQTNSSAISYSIANGGVYIGPGVANIINQDPLLGEGGYSLLQGSPGIDAGDPDEKDQDGTRIDIGFRADRFKGRLVAFNLTVSPQETVSGSGQYEPGTSATITATPNPGYRFTGWTGDASGTVNPLTITMNANKTVGATFEKDLSDSDNDGLTAFDELVAYNTNPALADSDGDGLSDGYELGVGRFSIITGSFTWQQARTNAQTRGGDLASFPTEDRWNRREFQKQTQR